MTTRHATIVTDLGFGDAGKGSVVDFLARQVEQPVTVVRFNGGAQAAHNVVAPDGRHHTFHLFGSGTLVNGVRTHLSRFVLFDPEVLRDEVSALVRLGCDDPLSRLSVDEDAMVVVPYYKSVNILQEVVRGTLAHGTCGMGIGEAMKHSLAFPDEVIRVGDLQNQRRFLKKLRRIQEHFYEHCKHYYNAVSARVLTYSVGNIYTNEFTQWWVEEMMEATKGLRISSTGYLRLLSRESNLVFEGAQGVLLDEWYGFHPHTTWSTTTFKNALDLLAEIGYGERVERLGVLRAYHTRHGAGPFPTEDAQLTKQLPDFHNEAGGWQGAFRVGWFDLVLARYALAVCGGADTLAVTNIDRFETVEGDRKVAVAYDLAGEGGRVAHLNVKPVLEDLGYQEALTRLLQKAEPVYHPVPNINQYLQMIEEDLRVPITVTSHGLSAGDKRLRMPVSAAA